MNRLPAGIWLPVAADIHAKSVLARQSWVIQRFTQRQHAQ